jgi:hypothetical protein
MNTSNSAQNTGKTVAELNAAVLKELLEADALNVEKLTKMVDEIKTNDDKPIEKINVIKREDVNYQLSNKSLDKLRDNFVTLDFLKAANARTPKASENLCEAITGLGCELKEVDGVLWAQKGDIAFPIIRSNAKFDVDSFKVDIMNSEYAYRIYKLPSTQKLEIENGERTVEVSELFGKKSNHYSWKKFDEDMKAKAQPETQEQANVPAKDFWKTKGQNSSVMPNTKSYLPQDRRPAEQLRKDSKNNSAKQQTNGSVDYSSIYDTIPTNGSTKVRQIAQAFDSKKITTQRCYEHTNGTKRS